MKKYLKWVLLFGLGFSFVLLIDGRRRRRAMQELKAWRDHLTEVRGDALIDLVHKN